VCVCVCACKLCVCVQIVCVSDVRVKYACVCMDVYANVCVHDAVRQGLHAQGWRTRVCVCS